MAQSIGLGALRPGLPRMVRIAAVFGLWDGISPLVGLLLGRYFGQAIGPVADRARPIVLGGYGLYLVARSLRREGTPELSDRWALFGLPLSLSLDNLIAGAGLGLLGFAPLFSAAIFSAITLLMSFAGLQLGRVAARFMPIRADRLSGMALIVTAILLTLGY